MVRNTADATVGSFFALALLADLLLAMPRLPFVLVYLAQFAYGFHANSTSFSHPGPTDGYEPMRTIWGILGSCAITLLICVWNALHFDIYYLGSLLYKGPVGLVLCSIVAPEVVVSASIQEWWRARCIAIKFREQGYKWSITHSFFAEMGGFEYRDKDGESRMINSFEFLDLCRANKIVNPVLTIAEIKDKSKSDALGKTILVIQLIWFTVQVAVRRLRGLAVTLVELDVVIMGVLTLLILGFWWEKPLRPRCPHVFYSPQGIRAGPRVQFTLGSEPSYLYRLVARLACMWRTGSITGYEDIALVGKHERLEARSIVDSFMAKTDGDRVTAVSLCATWLLLGGLHLIAWDFDFPTAVERLIWRIASVVLAGGSLVFFIAQATINDKPRVWCLDLVSRSVLISGIASRSLLVGLTLAGLRSLPPSAYQTVSWTAYIPHL